MQKLTATREIIQQKLLSYPLQNESELKKKWLWTGLFGGHRYSLGQDHLATLMAISFGGFGIWWLKDRSQLKGLVEEWNLDQEQRQKSGQAPQGTDGLVLTDPLALDSPPSWVKQPYGLITTVFMLFFTFPIKFSLFFFKLIKSVMGKLPVVGPIYTVLLNFQESLMKRSFAFMEAVQIAACTGLVSYIATQFECLELSFLMIGVTAVLTFTSVFTQIANTGLGQAALEWDYLLCSYYHHHRPDPFLVAYFKSMFLFIPRLLGWGSAGERTLYNRLASQAALISFIFIPIEILSSIIFGRGFSFVDMAVETLVGVVMSVFLLSMYAPAICGSLTRHKLLGEKLELKLSGGMSMFASICGLYLGL